MNIIYQGAMRRLEFTLARGDIFDAKTEAIVNSEQSDFVLAPNPETISGQIRHRYGRAIQEELDVATKKKVLRGGTVISSAGGKEFRRIYHVGFHEPDEWPGKPGCSDYGDFLEIIGSCIDQVLQSTWSDGLNSVAFPLIGCGVFELDEKMLILQFLDALERFDRQMSERDTMHAWLVIRDPEQTVSVLGHLVGLLVENRMATVALSFEPMGVSILDMFATTLSRRSNESWMKWQLCRFTEVALDFACFGLCRSTQPPTEPKAAFKEGKGLVFGTVQTVAAKLAENESALNKAAWGERLFSSLLREDDTRKALEEIRVQRNHLAHGRLAECRSLNELEKLVRSGLRLADWSKIPDECGPLDIESWRPWVFVSAKSGDNGLFEEWRKSSVRYVVPHTGERFDPTKPLHRNEARR